MKRLLALLLIVTGLASAPLHAGSDLWPNIPKATGKPHPEGNLFWRKNHMKLLVHDRDLTMRKGDRSIRASLKECIQCHAVKDEQGQAVGVDDPRHFCRACHDFAAVKVDCFMCHNSKPEESSQALLDRRLPDTNELAAYLKEAAQ